MVCKIINIDVVARKIITFPAQLPLLQVSSRPHPASRWAHHSRNVPAAPFSTLYIHQMLEKIPKNKSKIAVIVNSKGGCLAQTHLIIKKINDVARRNKAQVWTFAQEWALNAGFLLLASGNRVYVDSSSVVGGLEVGESKLLRGKIGEYIETVSYSSAPSYLSELKSNGPIDAAKKAEIEQIYSRFSSELNLEIRKLRENKISTNSDLKGWFVG